MKIFLQQCALKFKRLYVLLINPSSPYAVRYWLIWMAVGMLWLFVQTPYRFQLVIGKYLGLLMFIFAKRERKIAKINLSICFPALSSYERKKLLKKSFIAMGIGVLETALGFFGGQKKLQKRIHIEGLDYIKQALKNRKGVLAFTPHFACLHIAGRLLNLRYPFSAMFFPPKHPVFQEISRRSMHRFYQLAIPRNDARSLVKALKKNHAVLYTPDTDAGLKNSIFAPFFNIMTATVTATARFVQMSGCQIIPVNYFRDEKRKGYVIQFYPPLENYPTDNPYADAVLVNQWIEKFVLAHPEQYLWQYKRFKTRPAGEANFYSRR